jgi:hypothetical protein
MTNGLPSWTDDNGREVLVVTSRRDLTGCTAMWRSVVLVAFTDATFRDPNPDGPRTQTIAWGRRWEMAKAKKDAREWLLGESKDFHLVCGWADLSPSAVARRAREVFAAEDQRSIAAPTAAPSPPTASAST